VRKLSEGSEGVGAEASAGEESSDANDTGQASSEQDYEIVANLGPNHGAVYQAHVRNLPRDPP
jgi:hypothetical protein